MITRDTVACAHASASLAPLPPCHFLTAPHTPCLLHLPRVRLRQQQLTALQELLTAEVAAVEGTPLQVSAVAQAVELLAHSLRDMRTASRALLFSKSHELQAVSAAVSATDMRADEVSRMARWGARRLGTGAGRASVWARRGSGRKCVAWCHGMAVRRGQVYVGAGRGWRAGMRWELQLGCAHFVRGGGVAKGAAGLHLRGAYWHAALVPGQGIRILGCCSTGTTLLVLGRWSTLYRPACPDTCVPLLKDRATVLEFGPYSTSRILCGASLLTRSAVIPGVHARCPAGNSSAFCVPFRAGTRRGHSQTACRVSPSSFAVLNSLSTHDKARTALCPDATYIPDMQRTS